MSEVRGYVIIDSEEFDYELRADGWYVDFNDERGFQKFAVKGASEITVRQLIRKERSVLY